MATFPTLRITLALCGALAAAGALAADYHLTLSGADEVPPVSTTAGGTGTISVADDGSASGRISTTGIAGTMAHIHVGAVGQNGGPIVTLMKSGDGFEVPAGTRLTAEQLDSLKAGKLYVNVHSAANPKGEIRAQIK